MSDLGEGIGTATEGGLFARALEPESGAKSRREGDPENCLNCGTQLVGAYCHACGQTAHIHRTLHAFWHDLLHGALHFEGKLWRTLPLLVLRPGRLTRRYIEGARARFVSPMALFLFGVFLMFAVFQMVGLTTPASLDPPDVGEAVEQGVEAAAAEREQLLEDMARTEPGDPRRSEIQARLAELDDGLFAAGQVESITAGQDFESGFSGTGIAFIDDKLVKKWNENPGLMLYKLQANSYKFSWMLIPISIPFVWLLFAWKRRFKAYDHAIFVTYSLSFMTLLFVTLSVLGAAGIMTEMLLLAAMLIAPIHLYKQLRGTYELRRFSAFWRLIILSAFIWIVIALFIQMLLVLGAF